MMKRKDQRDERKVLTVLHQKKRFSIFEATANNTIARTMTILEDKKLISIDNSPGYPWSNVKLTKAGLAMIKKANDA